ncbi:hypothetical protein KIW84_062585 [Lathyrus oleraceus]|uniref:Uncharacterized protein n=1 Tax=Pisum sativum TaxID=3888 RepID=A0A9D4W7N0_PEA|nr:hypothetical protein KIW84_062585 [Pisum sativum]
MYSRTTMFQRNNSFMGRLLVNVLFPVGKTLEELRSSLYNELRTSEGAKRHQQRYCGLVVALSFNFMVAVGIIMANKLVMGRIGFNFPIFLTFVHYVTAWVLLAIFKTISVLPVSPPSKTTPFSSIFSLGAVMAFASGLANTSLKYNSSVHAVLVLALAAVSAGVAVATVSDLEFNLFGAIVAVIEKLTSFDFFSLLLLSPNPTHRYSVWFQINIGMTNLEKELSLQNPG